MTPIAPRVGVGCIVACALATVVMAVPALGQQSSTNGINGGYTGSDRWFQSSRDAAAERSTLERNLGQRDAGPAGGPEIHIKIVFPPAQKGVGNVMHILLRAEPSGTPEFSGLAAFTDRKNNAITTAFAPRKLVERGRTYGVYVVDATGHPYGPLARINIGHGSLQNFTIDAPMIGQSQPTPPSGAGTRYTPPKTTEYASPRVGTGLKAPSIGKGYVRPGVGSGYVPPGSR